MKKKTLLSWSTAPFVFGPLFSPFLEGFPLHAIAHLGQHLQFTFSVAIFGDPKSTEKYFNILPKLICSDGFPGVRKSILGDCFDGRNRPPPCSCRASSWKPLPPWPLSLLPPFWHPCRPWRFRFAILFQSGLTDLSPSPPTFMAKFWNSKTLHQKIGRKICFFPLEITLTTSGFISPMRSGSNLRCFWRTQRLMVTFEGREQVHCRLTVDMFQSLQVEIRSSSAAENRLVLPKYLSLKMFIIAAKMFISRGAFWPILFLRCLSTRWKMWVPGMMESGCSLSSKVCTFNHRLPSKHLEVERK